MRTGAKPLPRLVYIGDVPVSETMGGSVLLWRLLDDYPTESLLILETRVSDPSTRLAGTRYERVLPVLARLARTRFAPVVAPFVALTAGLHARAIDRRIRSFHAEAILTVTHGTTWLVASALAKRVGVPLFIVNHDWWPETLQAPAFVRPWLQQRFGEVYRQARARFCVSSQMAEHYRKRYGAHGAVLLPGRARSAQVADEPPAPRASKPFTLAYAGGIFHDCASVLKLIADMLARLGGRLVIFSDLSQEAARDRGLTGANILLKDFVAPKDLPAALRSEADALLVTREPGMGLNAIISFPSKLTDYTTTGLPILIYAPLDSAAAEWARDNEAALVVGIGDVDGLQDALARLAGSAEFRRGLGSTALAKGTASFSHDVVSRQFISAVEAA